MNVMSKYRDKPGAMLDGIDPVSHGVLVSFQKVVDGTAEPYVFQMVSDEHARGVLDDDDYEIWCEAKASSTGSR